ncbi:ferredoxin C 1, chloroplastic-like [Curcuma longa]|uniref:ferredoxin C 1, chloroplastic-like n=1 Tax=Curcuma longa TaxID=136217 RepID=UPI003D9F01F4
MATALLHFSAASAASSPLFTTPIFPRGLPSPAARLHCPPLSVRRRGRASTTAKAYKVTIEHEGESRTVEMEEDETILGRALEEGLAVPHDCKLGVCMTCPARLVSGTVDQSEGMLSDDVVERGYALLCASYPRSDCHIRTIPEEELLSLQLATAND